MTDPVLDAKGEPTRDRVLPPPLSPSAEQIEKLRALALAAISGYPMDTDECTGAWKAWFNFHGDPHVVEDGESSGVVAVVSTAPLDYGKARRVHGRC